VAENITAHHLASSLLTLADAHMKKPDPNEHDITVSCKLFKFASECYDVAHKKLDIKKCHEWIIKVRNEEKNFSMKDDLAWCLTLYGYALTRQRPKDSNDSEIYNKANIKLKEARKYHEQLQDKNYSNLVLNLFALSLTEYKLGGKRHHLEALETFREACLKLRYLTRNEKKVWYLDHVCTIMEKLKGSKFQVAEKLKDDEENFGKLTTWLMADTVREGRRALDEIIESVEKELEKSGEAGS
jgi:hypothetical protein